MSSPGTPYTARRELQAIVFRRRPRRCRSFGGKSNGSRFRRPIRPASCTGQCRGCARLLSCTLSRCPAYPRLVSCGQTFVRFSHAPSRIREALSLPAPQCASASLRNNSTCPRWPTSRLPLCSLRSRPPYPPRRVSFVWSHLLEYLRPALAPSIKSLTRIAPAGCWWSELVGERELEAPARHLLIDESIKPPGGYPG